MTEQRRLELQERVAGQSSFLAPVVGILLLALAKLLPEKKEEKNVPVTILLEDGTEIPIAPISTKNAEEYERLQELIQAENVRLAAHMYGVPVHNEDDRAPYYLEASPVHPFVARPMYAMDNNGRYQSAYVTPANYVPPVTHELSDPDQPPIVEDTIEPYDIRRDTFHGEPLRDLIYRYFQIEAEGTWFSSIEAKRFETGIRLYGVVGFPESPLSERVHFGDIDTRGGGYVSYFNYDTGQRWSGRSIEPSDSVNNFSGLATQIDQCTPSRGNLITGVRA